jgi:hypothetical protein
VDRRVVALEHPVHQGAEAGAAGQVVPPGRHVVQRGVGVARGGARRRVGLRDVGLVVLLPRLGLAAEGRGGGGRALARTPAGTAAGPVGGLVRGVREGAVAGPPPAEVEAAVEAGELQPAPGHAGRVPPADGGDLVAHGHRLHREGPAAARGRARNAASAAVSDGTATFSGATVVGSSCMSRRCRGAEVVFAVGAHHVITFALARVRVT